LLNTVLRKSCVFASVRWAEAPAAPVFDVNLHWRTITLRGTRSHRDGFGARFPVNGQTRFATSAFSYVSASDQRLHSGLGTAEKAKVEIVWASGTHQVLNEVHADQFLEMREPEKP
jgi:hypothetical protein